MFLTGWNTNEVGDICSSLCTLLAALRTEMCVSFTVLRFFGGFFVTLAFNSYLDCAEYNASLSEETVTFSICLNLSVPTMALEAKLL